MINLSPINHLLKSGLVLLMAGWATLSCDEKIRWDVDPEQKRIIVEGRITDELKQHDLLLRISNDFFDPENPSVVVGAQVSVTDGTNSYTYEEVSSGLYQSTEAFTGQVGITYELTIELEAPIGDQTRYTAVTTMQPNLTLDSLAVYRDELDDIFDEYDEDSTYFFSFFGLEPEGTGDHYLCELWRNGENYTDPINQVVIFEDDWIDGIEFEAFELFISADFDAQEEFQPGDQATLKIYAIEKQYFDFLNAFFAQEEGGDPFGFSSPPANVDGNISGTGLGYFYAASVVASSSEVGIE